ncbi:hypothetical protein OAE08_05210 [Gammaproteobacteria bacterium]|nr:hypothetical protein [Gammaproteobacteria bacterium]
MKLLATIILLCLPMASFAQSKAAWPFNTPAAKAGGICSNAADQAESAVEQVRDYRKGDSMISYIKREWMSGINQRRSRALKNDPRYADWSNIFYREMRRYVTMVWRIPDISPRTAKSIVEDHCNARKAELIRQLELTEPTCNRDWLGRCKE